MISLSVATGSVERSTAELTAMVLFEDKTLFSAGMERVRTIFGGMPSPVANGAFTGGAGQTLLLPRTGAKPRILALIGAGPSASFGLEPARRVAAAAIHAAQSTFASTVAIMEPDPTATRAAGLLPLGSTILDLAMSLAEGAILSGYQYDRYRTKKPADFAGVKSCTLLLASESRLKSYRDGIGMATAVSEAVALARDLANAPGNEIYPETLAERAQAAGRKHGFRVTVFDEKRIARERMGGLLGVAQGSHNPPRFIIMEYEPLRVRKAAAPVVLVGKGVTFDSGGISIKPSANMAEMKMDMSGAAAVIGTMQAAAVLKLPVHLIGLVPAAENLPGGNALKPGDIIRHHNGKTSEVDNTDAEGRLILADALSWAARYKPGVVIDLATLTGAVVVALGHVATGMLGTATEAKEQLRVAGERTYERVWELPLFEEYEKLIKSDIADVKNVGGRWAGAITGAMFLKYFVGSMPWVHLDIAGTAILEEAGPYAPRGGSGVGVRLLTDFLRHHHKQG
jgi:leucyl aminopeptidase